MVRKDLRNVAIIAHVDHLLCCCHKNEYHILIVLTKHLCRFHPIHSRHLNIQKKQIRHLTVQIQIKTSVQAGYRTLRRIFFNKD